MNLFPLKNMSSLIEGPKPECVSHTRMRIPWRLYVFKFVKLGQRVLWPLPPWVIFCPFKVEGLQKYERYNAPGGRQHHLYLLTGVHTCNCHISNYLAIRAHCHTWVRLANRPFDYFYFLILSIENCRTKLRKIFKKQCLIWLLSDMNTIKIYT